MLLALPSPHQELVSSFLETEDVFVLALTCHRLCDMLLDEKAPIWTCLLQRDVLFKLTNAVTRQQYMQHFHSLDSWVTGGSEVKEYTIIGTNEKHTQKHHAREVISIDLPGPEFDSIVQLGFDCVLVHESGFAWDDSERREEPLQLDLIIVKPSTGETMTSHVLRDAHGSRGELLPLCICFDNIRGIIGVFDSVHVTEYAFNYNIQHSADIAVEFLRTRQHNIEPTEITIPAPVISPDFPPEMLSHLPPDYFQPHTIVRTDWYGGIEQWKSSNSKNVETGDSEIHFGHNFKLEWNRDDVRSLLTVKRGDVVSTEMKICHCNHRPYAFDGRYLLCGDHAGEDAAYSFQIIDYRDGIVVKKGMDICNYIESQWKTLWLGSLSMLLVVESSEKQNQEYETKLVGRQAVEKSK